MEKGKGGNKSMEAELKGKKENRETRPEGLGALERKSQRSRRRIYQLGG